MKGISMSHALEFVENADLPTPRKGARESSSTLAFEQSKNQAAVVGSDIVSFVQGVTEERRNDIVRSSLLAQLVAKKKVPDTADLWKWYDEYFNVLTNIGWVIQEKGFAQYVETSEDFQAHKAIMEVAAALLGPAAAPLAVLKATLDALEEMNTESPWIRLFNRESQSGKTAKFQIMLVEQGDANQFLVSLMAFGLEAKATLTHVLFFKYLSSEVTFKHNAAKVTIDSDVLASVREVIKGKLAMYTNDYVSSLPDLE